MSFTDQKQRITTENDLELKWGFRGGRLRCYLCGYLFIVGDKWRWVYAGRRNLTNFVTCESCDGEDVLDRWEAANTELKKRFWWA